MALGWVMRRVLMACVALAVVAHTSVLAQDPSGIFFRGDTGYLVFRFKDRARIDTLRMIRRGDSMFTLERGKLVPMRASAARGFIKLMDADRAVEKLGRPPKRR